MKMLYKVFSFLEVTILAFIGRGLGILAVPLIALLSIDPLKWSIIPAAYFFVRGIVAFPTGSFIDRFPRFGFLVGGFIFCIGMWWMSYTLTDYYYFIIGIIITSIGSTGMQISANTLGVRSEGFGKTWDMIGVGIGHSFVPILVAVITGFILNISMTFKIIGILGLIVDVLFILTFTNVNVRENKKSSLKETFNCFNNIGFTRLLFSIITIEILGMFVYVNFSLALADVGISEKMAIFYFLCFYGVMGIILRFPYAHLGNKYGTRICLIAIMSIIIIGNIVFMIPNDITRVVGLFITGIGNAGYSITLVSYIGDRWDRKQTASMFGIVVMLGSLTGPLTLILQGYLRNITNTYTLGILVFNVIAIIAYFIFISEKDILYLDKVNGIENEKN